MVSCHTPTIPDRVTGRMDDIETAVRRLARDTRMRESACLERRSEVRLPFHRPVRVTPVTDDEESFDITSPDTFTACTRDISCSGVGFLHDQPIHSHRVLLTFELLDGDSVSLLVQLQWCRFVHDFWYATGGRLIGLVSSVNKASPEAEPEDLFT